MILGQIVTAWLDVRSKPLRTLAAISGIMAAIIAVVVVDSAALLSRQANTEYIESIYGRTATINISMASSDVLSEAEARARFGLLEDRMTANGIDRISTAGSAPVVLVRDTTAISEQSLWVSSTWPSITRLDIVAGAFPGATARGDTIHAVVTANLADQLGFVPNEAVGQRLLYRTGYASDVDLRVDAVQPLVIDAVIAEPGPQTNVELLLVSDLYRPELSGSLSWLAHVDPGDVALAIDTATGAVDAISGTTLFQARRSDQSQNLTPVLNQQRVTANVVTIVSLTIAGLGILGLGMAGVRERGREFGLRRALGATTRSVFASVLAQTVFEVILSAIIAIPASVLIVRLAARQLVLSVLPLPDVINVPFSSALKGVTAALAVGVLASLLPAIRAARMSVVQSLRD